MHLYIAAVEILSFKPDDYFRTQQSWKQEVNSLMRIYNQLILIG